MDYAKSVQINSTRLDRECIEQAGRYLAVSDEYANTLRKVRQIKDELTVLEAQLELGYRTGKKPMPPEILKPTEAVYSALIDSDPELIQKKEELAKAQYENDVVSGALESFSQRKKMLELIVSIEQFVLHSDLKNRDPIREMRGQGR